MVGQPHRNFMKMASWSSVSEHLVNPIGMSDQLKWNNHISTIVIKCVQIYSKESFNMKTSNIINYKLKFFAELLGVSVKIL